MKDLLDFEKYEVIYLLRKGKFYMFSNLIVVTVIVFVLWLGAMGYYLYASRQQESLEEQVEAVQKILNDSNQNEA